MKNLSIDNIDKSWHLYLKDEFQQPYLQQLDSFLAQEKKEKKTIFPPKEDIFNALNATTFKNVKAVIIGQDPYHGEGQAHGMCFSVHRGERIPPSLKNIYKEIFLDLRHPIPSHGNLEHWATQGVLLLNNVLTVEEANAGSHHKKGWEIFTDKIIEVLNQRKKHLVFFLWGSHAQKKASQVDSSKHFIMKSVHPSPLSAHRGFFEQKQFSRCNKYLVKNKIIPIDWKIPK